MRPIHAVFLAGALAALTSCGLLGSLPPETPATNPVTPTTAKPSHQQERAWNQEYQLTQQGFKVTKAVLGHLGGLVVSLDLGCPQKYDFYAQYQEPPYVLTVELVTRNGSKTTREKVQFKTQPTADEIARYELC